VAVVIFVAIQGAYRFGDMVAWVGDGQLAGVTASTGEAAANIAAGPG